MMTPEEIQRTMDFILASQANSVIRMDRVEQNLDRLERNVDRHEKNLDSLVADLSRLGKELAQQK